MAKPAADDAAATSKDAPAKNAPAIERTPIEGEWAGIPQYRCPFCPYDSLFREAVQAHIAEKHPLPPPPITSPASPDMPAPDVKES